MIKQEVEELLGVKIETFGQTFAELDTKGKLDQKTVYKLLDIILTHLSEAGSPQDAPKTPLKLEKIPVYNPDSEDFKCVMRDEKTNKQMEPYIVPAQDIAYFEPKVAEHIKKQLAGYLLSKRGTKTNSEDELIKINEEIAVKK